MEVGESSAANPSQEIIWAKLVPSDLTYSEVELRLDETVIRSNIMLPSSDKQEWCKVTRNSDLCSATIQNKSSNTILVDDAAIPSEDSIVIKCGSEIIPGPKREGYLSYRFEVMSPQNSIKEPLKICLDIEHAKCSICLNIWHDVVTVAPCLHNFCNGCFSEWLRRSQEKHSNVLCPQCRAVVQFVGRNHFLHNIEENILQVDPSLRRSDEEVAVLESHASIQSNLVIKTGKNLGRKRAHSSLNEEREELEFPCPQCGNLTIYRTICSENVCLIDLINCNMLQTSGSEYAGFLCNLNTVHLQCHACGGMMPSRNDIGVPQHCLGCDRAFCGAYWHSQRFGGSDSYPVCSNATLKPISDRTISRIPALAHENNRHEQNITERCIRQMGTTLPDVISEFLIRLNNRQIDRTRMPLNHSEMITAGTYVCNECYDKLVSFLLYWFRVCMPKSSLPPDASKREDCWYGFACRTQQHNEEHAQKRNHVCRPTRGRYI